MELFALLGFALFVLGAYAMGRILSPVLRMILKRITSKTKSTLDDRILEEVEGPLESFFLLIIMYFGIKYVKNFQYLAPIADRYVLFALIVVLTFLAVKVVKAISHWYYEEGHQKSHIKIDLSLMPLLQKIAQIAIGLVGGMMALNEAGFDITGLLAVTSIAGLIIGLASQETLGNLFAGLALQVDRPYVYGDYLRLPSGEAVKLRRIGMRSTFLYDLAGNPVIISNSEFAKLRVVKIGKTNEKGDIAIPFEAPIGLKVDDLEKHLAGRIQDGKIEGIAEMEKIKASVSKVKAPGWYEGSINIRLKDLSYSPQVAEFVNGIILEKVREFVEKNRL